MSNLQTCPRRVLRARKSTAPYLSLSSWAILSSTVIYLAIYSSSQVRSCVAGLLRPLVFHLVAWSWETVQHSKNTWHVKNRKKLHDFQSESNFNMSTGTSLREACNEMLTRCHLKAVVINRFSMKQPNTFTLLFAGSLWTNWCGLFNIFVVRFCNRNREPKSTKALGAAGLLVQPQQDIMRAYQWKCLEDELSACPSTAGSEHLQGDGTMINCSARIHPLMFWCMNKTTHLKQPFQKMFQL